MLVLSRKVGQRLMIGDDIVVTVVDVVNGKIKLGVSAPRDVRVFREELLVSGRKCRYCETGEGSSCTCL